MSAQEETASPEDGRRVVGALLLYRARLSSTPEENHLVDILALQMLRKLKANRHKNPNGNDWRHLTRRKLLTMLEDETEELHVAADTWDSTATSEEIAAECGDVANIVAMILDQVMSETD